MAFACFFNCHEKHETEQPNPEQPDYAIFYRSIPTRSSWHLISGTIVFDKTEVILISKHNSGYEFKDTCSPQEIRTLIKSKLELMKQHPNISFLKDFGFIQLEKKILPNEDKFLVMSNDSNFIFVYRILNESLEDSLQCELYGSHSRDSSQVYYQFHMKEDEILTFRKLKTL